MKDHCIFLDPYLLLTSICTKIFDLNFNGHHEVYIKYVFLKNTKVTSYF